MMKFSSAIRTIDAYTVQPLLNWLYPQICLLCELPILSGTQFVCKTCWESIPHVNHQSLDSLWLSRNKTEKIYLDGFYSCFPFTDSMQKIIHSLKYERMTKIVHEIIQTAVADIMKHEEITSCDYLVPVPLHKKRQKSRGFNQSVLIAKELSKYLNIKMADNLLVRNRNTHSQTQLNAEERQKNVKDAFGIKNHKFLSDSNILLIDDLITTGATANECAKVLKKSFSGRVLVLVVAHPL